MSGLAIPGSLSRRLYKVMFSDPEYGSVPEEVESLEEANAVGSQLADNLHALSIDLDVPAVLVPSSTSGHSHLYIDVPMSWDQYERILVALADAGVIENGYLQASLRRKFTCLRLPWIRKEAA